MNEYQKETVYVFQKPLSEIEVDCKRIGVTGAAAQISALEMDLAAHRNSQVHMIHRMKVMAEHIVGLEDQLVAKQRGYDQLCDTVRRQSQQLEKRGKKRG